MGFLSLLGVILWMPFFILGTLTVTVYSAYLGFGHLGIGIFVGTNSALAIFWNKARKHGRADAIDDRLSSERMEQARSWWMNKGQREKEEET